MTSAINKQITHPRLKAFAKRFGQDHLDLACHAAFPLAVTPELLYCLRENFQPQAPWVAVADIIFSLCDPVGYELYELEPEVRNELIVTLKENSNFGDERLYELSDFMVAYIRQKLQTNYRADEDLGAAPQWTALAYIRPEVAVNDIAKELKQALAKPNRAEWVKLTSLIESYDNINPEPLANLNFKPLLELARGWDAQARGETEIAQEKFAQLRREHGKDLQVGGFRFEIPTPEDDNLQTIEFETVTVNRRGEIINRETKTAQYFTENLPNNITLDMVYIPGGKFMMGTEDEEVERLVKKFNQKFFREEKPQHEVTVPAFFMGKYPVTQAQWKAVANFIPVEKNLEIDPSKFKGDTLPVEQVSWYDAVEFCARLSNYTGREYRLPSEAKWEYACRAGTKTPFHFGETITSELANYNASGTFADEPQGENREKTTPVGTFPPNAFCMYNVHDNVLEWCLDEWHENYENAPDNGEAWLDKNEDQEYQALASSPKLLRGGSWYDYPVFCRVSDRYRRVPAEGNKNIGFRVVCVIPSRSLS